MGTCLYISALWTCDYMLAFFYLVRIRCNVSVSKLVDLHEAEDSYQVHKGGVELLKQIYKKVESYRKHYRI